MIVRNLSSEVFVLDKEGHFLLPGEFVGLRKATEEVETGIADGRLRDVTERVNEYSDPRAYAIKQQLDQEAKSEAAAKEEPAEKADTMTETEAAKDESQ